MPQPNTESLTAKNRRLENELDALRGRIDDLEQQAGYARQLAEDAVKAAEAKAEEDAGRIASLKAILAEKDEKIAGLEGYIKRVHEEDDSTSPLGEKQPAPEVPRTRLARENGHSIRTADGDWVTVNMDSRPRHWSSI